MDDRCRSGKRCAAHTADGPAVTVKHHTLCAQCVVDIQHRYDQLPDVALALKCFKGGSMKVAYESKVSATKVPAVPLNLTVVVLLDDIDELDSFVNGYRIQDLIMQPAQEFHDWINGVEQRVFYDGVDRALRVRRVHHRVSDAVGLAPVWQRRAAPCPDCLLPTLGQWGGANVVQCGNIDCGMSMPMDEYERLCIERSRHGSARPARNA